MIYNLKDKRKRENKTTTNFEISSYPSQHGKDQQNNLQQMLGSGDMGKGGRQFSFAFGGIANSSHFGNQCGESSKI